MKKLNVLSIGAGAIGTYIGGSLALQGHNLVFVERPKIAERLQTQGLHLNIGDQEYHIPGPQVFTSITEAVSDHHYSVALFALKSFDTTAFIHSVVDYGEVFPPILCLSNGVENESALTSAFGIDKVIAGTITSAVGRKAPGEITLERMRGVGIADDHHLSSELVSAFNQAGLNARLITGSADMKWSKMLTNLIANATSAILDISPREIFNHPGLYELEILQLRETLEVMRAHGIKVIDLPGTPVGLLSLAIRYLPLTISRPLLSNAVGSGRGTKMPSFHVDLYNGRGFSEVDFLNGAVVRYGSQKNIPTPVNKLLNDILLRLTDNTLPLNSYRHQPDKLLSALMIN